jgi:hypothetical protein
MDTRIKGVMGDPPLFDDLRSNNRARTQISFGHDHPLPPTDWQTIKHLSIHVFCCLCHCSTVGPSAPLRPSNLKSWYSLLLLLSINTSTTAFYLCNIDIWWFTNDFRLKFSIFSNKKNGADPISDACGNDSQLIFFHGPSTLKLLHQTCFWFPHASGLTPARKPFFIFSILPIGTWAPSTVNLRSQRSTLNTRWWIPARQFFRISLSTVVYWHTCAAIHRCLLCTVCYSWILYCRQGHHSCFIDIINIYSRPINASCIGIPVNQNLKKFKKNTKKNRIAASECHGNQKQITFFFGLTGWDWSRLHF